VTGDTHKHPPVAFLYPSRTLASVAVEIEDGKCGEEPDRLVTVIAWIHSRNFRICLKTKRYWVLGIKEVRQVSVNNAGGRLELLTQWERCQASREQGGVLYTTMVVASVEEHMKGIQFLYS